MHWGRHVSHDFYHSDEIQRGNAFCLDAFFDLLIWKLIQKMKIRKKHKNTTTIKKARL